MRMADLPRGDQRAHDLIDRAVAEPDPRRAIHLLQRALGYGRQTIQGSKAYMFLGERYAQLGTVPRSIHYYSQALRVAEDDAVSQCRRGLLYYRRGEWAAARADLEEALRSESLQWIPEDKALAERYLVDLRRQSR